MLAKRTNYLSSDSGPHFQGRVVAATQNAIAVELQTSDDVVIMTSHHDWSVNRLVEPIILNKILAHVCRLPGALTAR